MGGQGTERRKSVVTLMERGPESRSGGPCVKHAAPAPSAPVSPVSLVRLGWYFVRRLLARALWRQRGLLRFRRSYEREGLFSLDREEQEAIACMSRCIACGVCDAHFGAYESISRTALRGPSDLVLSQSRSLPDWAALAVPLAQLERGDLDTIERLCPARIPLARVARVAKKRALALAAQGERDAPALPRRLEHDPG
jgi:hypothetical protein